MATRVQRFRPNPWRNIIRKEAPAPWCVERIEVQKIDMYADVKPTNMVKGTPPKPSIARAQSHFGVYEFQCAYDVLDVEVERARGMGLDLVSYKAIANQTAVEKKLDEIAAGGETLLSLPGLANNSTVAASYTVTKVGGAWSDSVDPEDMLADLHNLANAVYENSLENFSADTIVLPLSKYHLIVKTRLGDGTDETVLTAFTKQSPYVRKVVPWNRLATLGAGNGTRAVAFDSQAAEGPKMIVLKELTDDAPVRQGRGYEINQSFIVGGVMIEHETTLAYMDGI
jgi:hypothetical protein